MRFEVLIQGHTFKDKSAHYGWKLGIENSRG
jgi:hypothetical protein